MKQYENDGNQFSSLEQFYDEISKKLILGSNWGRNLDAFNDILRGGFGTPEGGFVLVWKNSEKSRKYLGMEETIRYIERKLATCHPSNVASVQMDLELAKEGIGQSLFDLLVEIIRDHGPGGDEEGDNITLILQ